MEHILSFHLCQHHHPSCQFRLLLHRYFCLCTNRICEPCAYAAALWIWQQYRGLLDDSVASKHITYSSKPLKTTENKCQLFYLLN